MRLYYYYYYYLRFARATLAEVNLSIVINLVTRCSPIDGLHTTHLYLLFLLTSQQSSLFSSPLEGVK
jgi:hypothetical protein